MHKIRKLSELQKYPGNPRTIDKDDLEGLAQSLKANTEYFQSRPLILSNRTGKLVILAGNQKFEAAKLAGIKQVPTYLIEGLTEKQEQEIVIRDNAHAGEWDFDELRENWGHLPLGEWMANDWEGVESEQVEDKTPSPQKPTSFTVVIEVQNEKEQYSTFEKLTSQGYNCRISTM